MLSTVLVALSIMLSSTVSAMGPVGTLTIVNKEVALDGFSRSAVLANGVYPAPLITAQKGDKFQLKVVNDLNDSTMHLTTSIHWHGLLQRGTAFADGVAGVTQCPIIPGNSFLYEFAGDSVAGTFWYHSHMSTQYCDGLRGPIVVYDPQDPHADLYDVDDESTVITLSEWYHVKAPEAGLDPEPMATLINGAGRYAGGPNVPLTVITVNAGQRYRMRLVNMACDPNYTFSIDGHDMTIIEADGENTQPLTVDSLVIFAGQRYSFVLNANQPVDNYWIRANPNLGTTGFPNNLNSAILRYVGASESNPTTPEVTPMHPLNEWDLRALKTNQVPGSATPGGADVALNLKTDFNFDTMHFTINGNSFIPPDEPVLLQILSGARTAQELLPSGTVIELPKNKVIEISIPGGDIASPHPFHLHGHAFDVIRSAGSSNYNFVDPVRRDVVNLGMAGNNVTFRFTTDNPGPWIMHCHIDWHLELGLAVVFAEAIDDIASLPPPANWDTLCPAYDDWAAKSQQA